jgi:hypothetical protein
MTSNYYVLLVTRFCFGAGEAGAFPNIGICVSRWFPVQTLLRTPSSRGRFGRRGCHTDLPSRNVVFLEDILNLLSGELGDDLAGVLLFI